VSSKAEYDLAIVGCGFAGLIAAATAASRGLSVVVLESKPRSGARVHTTGTLVKEAAEELAFPVHLTRKIRGVRLYSPNLKAVDLSASGYFTSSRPIPERCSIGSRPAPPTPARVCSTPRASPTPASATIVSRSNL
jgi:2-polyprenyl-6-methoxyphenol hydroxylase-like FAD-dependent oxidoreductase